jgi:undecaprenyl-diphosphatase
MASRTSERRWWPFSRAVLVGWTSLLALTVVVGALITGPLHTTELLRWDREVPVELAPQRTGTVNSWSHWGSLAGDTPTVVTLAVLVGLVLLLLRGWTSVLLLATALVIEVSVFVATTIVVPRDRPRVEQLDVSPPTSSFPSGHTAAATALALCVALIVTWHLRSAAARGAVWLMAVLVGPVVACSRVYRGMHHPLDVLVGLLLGVACVVVAFVAVRAWVGSARPLAQHEESSAQPADEESRSHPTDSSANRLAS